MTSGPAERAHAGLLLQALYPLGGKVPGLERVPRPVRRATRRATTAAAVRGNLRRCRATTVVALTGSRGKTTLKDLLACMLAEAGPTVRTRHNDNDLYGTPATLLAIRPQDRFAVVETGVLRPGDMAWMAGLMRPDVAILTGIGDDHLAAFGSRAALATEKRRLLERVRGSGVVIVPADDPLARRAAANLPARVVTAGRDESADVRLLGARLSWPHGLQADVAVADERVRLRVALHGLHLAPLVALALAAARACGLPMAVAAAGAARFEPPPGRLRPAPGPDGSLLLLDDAKCRPATAAAGVRALGALPARRRVAVVGELQEVPAEPAAYAPLAAELAAHADAVIAVGGSAAPLTSLLGDRVVSVAGVAELAGRLRIEARAGVAILLTGANAQHLQRAQLLLEGADVGCRVARCRLHWRCTDCPYLAGGPPARVVETA